MEFRCFQVCAIGLTIFVSSCQDQSNKRTVSGQEISSAHEDKNTENEPTENESLLDQWDLDFINTDTGFFTNQISTVHANDERIYLGINGIGVVISIDGGNSWKIRTPENGLVGSNVNLIFAEDNKIYAGSAGGLSISQDYGETWTGLQGVEGLCTGSFSRILAQGERIYAACRTSPDDGVTTGGVSMSTDGGITWTRKSALDGLISNDLLDLQVKNGKIFLISLPDASGLSALMVSEDEWATWQNYEAPDLYQLYINENKLFAIGNANNDLFYSIDEGKTWLRSPNMSSQLTAIAQYEDAIVVGNVTGLAFSFDDGLSWQSMPIVDRYGDTHQITDISVDGDVIYAKSNMGTGGIGGIAVLRKR